MADIVSINKVIDDNYISHDGTRLYKWLTGTTVWENNYSSTNSIASQTISIDLSTYSYYEIFYNSLYNSAVYSTGKKEIGEQSDLAYFFFSDSDSSWYLASRKVTVNSNSIVIGDCTFGMASVSSASTMNTRCRPFKIICYS